MISTEQPGVSSWAVLVTSNSSNVNQLLAAMIVIHLPLMISKKLTQKHAVKGVDHMMMLICHGGLVEFMPMQRCTNPEKDMLNSILVRAHAHHAAVLRQAGSCPSDPATRQKMGQACRAAGTDCTTHPVSVCPVSLRASGNFCSCATVSSVRHHPCRLA